MRSIHEYFSFFFSIFYIFTKRISFVCVWSFFFNWILNCISRGARHWHQSFFAKAFLDTFFFEFFCVFFLLQSCLFQYFPNLCITDDRPLPDWHTKDQSNSCGSVTFDYAKYAWQSASSQNNNLRPQLESAGANSLCPPISFWPWSRFLALTTANFHKLCHKFERKTGQIMLNLCGKQ